MKLLPMTKKIDKNLREVTIKKVKTWLLVVDTSYYSWNGKKTYDSYLHFQEDSNILKYVLLGYCINKFWISEVSIIASPKVWICSISSSGEKTTLYSIILSSHSLGFFKHVLCVFISHFI